MPADTGNDVLTIDELSKYLKVSKSTLYKLAQEGNVPAQKVGKHWRFHKDAVDRWLKKEGPATVPPKMMPKPKRLLKRSDWS